MRHRGCATAAILAVLVLAVCYILMLRLTDRNKPEKAAVDTSAEKEQ